jgi:hypothetical protein
MDELKQSKNSIGIPITEGNRPDQIEEVTPDVDYFIRWKTPGTLDGNGDFIEDTNEELLICRSTTAGNTAAFAKWSDRETAKYVPWSQRSLIIK